MPFALPYILEGAPAADATRARPVTVPLERVGARLDRTAAFAHDGYPEVHGCDVLGHRRARHALRAPGPPAVHTRLVALYMDATDVLGDLLLREPDAESTASGPEALRAVHVLVHLPDLSLIETPFPRADAGRRR